MLFRERMNNRLFLVDLLAILFGISSWISINGLWVELPMLVNKLPEYWSLPSYLSIIVQIANIGPIIYGLLRNCLRTPPPQHISVITLLSIGCLASLALVLTWDLTSTFNFINDDGEDDSLSMSTGLFLSVFFLALVDCTSSVLFLPYMGIFKQKYLNSYLIGKLSCLKKYLCQLFCSWNLISYNFLQFPCIGSTKVITGGWNTRFLGGRVRLSDLPPNDHQNHCVWFSSRSP